jgi:glycosyltransferase involved in cell wall biosynthesis
MEQSTGQTVVLTLGSVLHERVNPIWKHKMAIRRVLIDGYFLGKPYGFGRFIFELCRALGRAETDLEFVVAVPVRVDVALLPDYKNLSWHRLPDANFIIWEQFMIPKLARELSCDAIHFPYNTRALFTGNIRTVTTVHDVLFLKEHTSANSLKGFIAAKYAKYVFKYATRKSRNIVSVSETTRRSLLSMGIDSRTVYNTIDGFIATFNPSSKERNARPYMLHRGGYLAHRNTKRVIDAFREARRALPDVSLKIIGAPEGAGRWQSQRDETIQYLPRISDQELAELYAGSACIVATSLQEGFGLPIIEGFGFGAPVITSNLNPMMEVAGNAALFVDPYSVPDIARAMVSIMSDPALAQALIALGYARLELFGSTRVAEQMLEIYRS